MTYLGGCFDPDRFCVVCARYGEPTKQYINRQVEAFRTTPSVLCWRRFGEANADTLDRDFLPTGSIAHRIARVTKQFRPDPYGPTKRERTLLVQRLKSLQPSAILAHTGHVAMRVTPAARELGVPVFAYFHGVDFTPSLRDPAYAAKLQAMRNEWAGVIIVGAYMEEWFLQHGYAPDQVHLIPCGAPLDEIEPKPTYETRSAVAFIAAGRLVPYKAFDDLLKAFARTDPFCRLRIIGEGPERVRLQSLARELGVADRVEFCGELDNRSTLEAMRESDVFIHLPVDDFGGPEAFGVVVTEAGACGLPMVVTRCGGVTDQVAEDESAFVVPQHDVGAAAAAMRQLAENAELRVQMGRRARVEAEKFNSATLARKLEQVIYDTIGQLEGSGQ